MLLGMGSREVHGEQRIEVFQRLLRYLAAHLLRLVQNEDRTVCLDNVDGSAGTELIPLGVDDAGSRVPFPPLHIFIFVHGGRKGLGIDYHHVDAAAG